MDNLMEVKIRITDVDHDADFVSGTARLKISSEPDASFEEILNTKVKSVNPNAGMTDLQKKAVPEFKRILRQTLEVLEYEYPESSEESR